MNKISVLFFLTLPSICSFGQSRKEYIEMGIFWTGKAEYQKAIEIYDEAISKYRDDAELLVLRGEEKSKLCLSVYLKHTHIPSKETGLCNSAMDDFNKALAITDTFCHVYHSRGYLYLNVQDYKSALEDYSNMIDCSVNDEDKVQGLVNRGTCYLRLDKSQKALNDFNEGLKIAPNDFGIYNNIASVFTEKGDYENAEKYLMQAMKIDSTQISILNNLGFLRIQQNDFEAALRIYENIYKSNNTDPFVLNNLGFAQCKLGDIESGLRNINKSIRVYPDNSYAYKYRGIIYSDIGEKEKACKDFNKAISLGYTETYDDEVKDLMKNLCK